MAKRGGGRRQKRALQWAEQQRQQNESGKKSEEQTASNESVEFQKEGKTNDGLNVASNKRQRTDITRGDGVEVRLFRHNNNNDDDDEKVAHGMIPPPVNLNESKNQALVEIQDIWKFFGNDKVHASTGNWKPSNIQSHLWSILLNSSWNTIGVAPTGSGKTLAYSIPSLLSILQKSATSPKGAILVLVPTRELVTQVAKVFTKVAKAAKKQDIVTVVNIHGGVSRKEQIEKIQKLNSASVIVATPGRLLDLTKEISFPKMDWIILDEADQLAKDGDLGPQVDEILSAMKKDDDSLENSSRLVLVSATYPEKAKAKFQEWVGDAHVLVQVDGVRQEVATTPTKPETNDDKESGSSQDSTSIPQVSGLYARIPSHLEQVLHVCSEHKKPRKLLHTLESIYKKQGNNRARPLGMVFFSKIEKLKHVSKLLQKEGYASVELHSQLATSQLREQNLSQFASGKKPLLLATDLAARGIDIPSIQFVIQYDFPGNLQQYVHRCGRAGRSDTTQKASVYSFFTRNLERLAPDLIQLLRANNAWVDPNLKALVGGSDKTGGEDKKAKSNSKQNRKGGDDDSDDEEEFDDFPELSANRIVLKRASHVSDASSSSDEGEDSEINEEL